MCGALRHRGPDEFGAYRDDDVGLAHARLSIIDIHSGQQPLSNEDGSLWISFNGEIFDYLELRAELEAHGHRFKTQSDTEVIVHAWEQWGERCFERMNGQWAIALWDRKCKRLILSRDRVGVRPLYFGAHRGRMYFASEVKAIFAADPTFPRELDARGIDETFTFWSVVPPQSVFVGIEELEPGHTLIVGPEGTARRRACGVGFPARGHEAALSLEEATEAVTEALDRATHLRMTRADVRVGAYLSGGLDSSLIAALGLRAKGTGFSTFSLRFEEPEYDETRHQREMIALLGSDHHEVMCRVGDIVRVFPKVVYHAERPLLRAAPAPMYLLSELVHQSGVKVVLTGEGADEMFAGYDLFREAKLRRFCARAPESKCRALLLQRLYPYLARSPGAMGGFTEQFFLRGLEHADRPGFSHDLRWRTTRGVKRFFAASFRARLAEFDAEARLLANLPTDYGTWSKLSQDQYLEIRTLLAGYVLASQGDRMLMANSVEGRFPFLDRDVMALANRLPPAHKLHVLDEKHVLKRMARGLVPGSIIDRPKQPYRAPDAASFVAEPGCEYVEAALSAASIRDAGVFDPDHVSRLWRKCKAQRDRAAFSNADNMALVGVLSTQLLHRQLIVEPVVSAPVELTTWVEPSASGS
jgi:asparagine synthase (glutamine-hydrolysing)